LPNNIEGLPPGATLKPIQGLPAGAELRPLGGQPPQSGNDGFFGPIQDAYDNFVSPLRSEARIASPGAAMADDFGRGVLKTFGDPVFHPVDTVKSLSTAIAHPGAATRGVASSIEADPNRAFPEAMGSIGGAGIAAPMAEMGLSGISKVADMVPTKAKAGQLFDSVMKDAANQPVQLTRSMPILERAMQLSDAGHGTVTPLDKLYARINQTQPLEYSEARDRASALSSLTGEDKIRATKTLQGQAKQLSHAFNDDVGDAAAQVGRGEDYAKAMKTYRQASQIREGLKNAGKVATGAAATAVVGPKLYGYIRSITGN